MKGIYEPPDMIKAIVEGRKTQTRRLHGLKEINRHPDEWHLPVKQADDEGRWWFSSLTYEQTIVVKPRFHVGEVVFRQEAWADYCPIWFGYWCGHGTKEGIIKDHRPVYKSDPEKEQERPINAKGDMSIPVKWKSPMMMPEWAARDHLRIKDVRAERLQEITPEDCIAEGIGRYTFARGCLSENPPDKRWKFIELWDSINKKQKWDLNPWTFRYVFEQVK